MYLNTNKNKYFAGLDVEQRTLRVPQLPSGLEGKRVVFAADFHAEDKRSRQNLRCAMQTIAELAPDILLFGGDLAESRKDAYYAVDLLASIQAPLGCFCVLGNNDVQRFRNHDLLRRYMAQNGIRLLVNASVEIAVQGGRLLIGGVDEAKYGEPDAKHLFQRSDSEDFRVLLSHYPQAAHGAFENAEELWPQLTLCGHTHGGQFRIGRLNPYSIGFERAYIGKSPTFFVSGWNTIGQSQVLVSNGIGTSRIPLRIGARSQIHLIMLERG